MPADTLRREDHYIEWTTHRSGPYPTFDNARFYSERSHPYSPFVGIFSRNEVEKRPALPTHRLYLEP